MKKHTHTPNGFKEEDYTTEEEAQFLKDKESVEKMIADQKALDDKKISDKAAATTKLKALGLTDDEIAALSS
mgnify:CR=1 FL=1|jgi:hypothetical protein|tara:strand:- start:149 stop:364 length:216 start_codon:yes stop_codon:yes gene_type:complete